jgi:hypothetical protein
MDFLVLDFSAPLEQRTGVVRSEFAVA